MQEFANAGTGEQRLPEINAIIRQIQHIKFNSVLCFLNSKSHDSRPHSLSSSTIDNLFDPPVQSVEQKPLTIQSAGGFPKTGQVGNDEPQLYFILRAMFQKHINQLRVVHSPSCGEGRVMFLKLHVDVRTIGEKTLECCEFSMMSSRM